MSTTGLPRHLVADLARVGESLEMLSPRWTVWTLMTLSTTPLRFTEIKSRLGMLLDSQLAQRLTRLTADGLAERRELNYRHVDYRLSPRGEALAGVIAALAAYGDEHLDKEAKPNRRTGQLEVERIPPAQNAEDVLALITSKHTAPLLWALRSEGRSSGIELASLVHSDGSAAHLYPTLRQLIRDGLVHRASRNQYELSASGLALAPVFHELSAWAAGRRTAAAAHPLWNVPAGPEQQIPAVAWAATRSRSAPPTGAPWQPGNLFSHSQPVRPALAGAQAGGRAR